MNVAIAGGPCTGKSTLAALLYSQAKLEGVDYDLVTEESRHVKKEFGTPRSPFDRFFMWRRQERAELRSTGADGFITDAPLFQFYVAARIHQSEPRDVLAVRELYRMVLETEGRYGLVVMAKDPGEFAYVTDGARSGGAEYACRKHTVTRAMVEHLWPEKLLLVSGTPAERVAQVLARLRSTDQRLGLEPRGAVRPDPGV